MRGFFAQPLLRWLLAVTLHILLFQHLTWGNGWWMPSMHLYGLVMLPLTWRPLTYLIAAGMTGWIIDLATLGGGLHTAAALLMGWLHPHIIRLFAPREGHEKGAEPHLQTLGAAWFAAHTALLIGVFHITLFALESGRWGLLPVNLAKAMTSTLLTWVLFIGIHLLFAAPARRR
ncbi:MAG: hypothetical protein RJA19_208 [Bacteroidota bacterium]|jgi:hypothetical protein